MNQKTAQKKVKLEDVCHPQRSSKDVVGPSFLDQTHKNIFKEQEQTTIHSNFSM